MAVNYRCKKFYNIVSREQIYAEIYTPSFFKLDRFSATKKITVNIEMV